MRSFFWPARLRRAGAAGLAALMFAGLGVGLSAPAQGDDLSGAEVRLAALDTQVAALGQAVSGLKGGLSDIVPLPPAGIGNDGQSPAVQAPVLVAQSRNVAALDVRLSQLEEQVRTLTGQVQGLQFQMTQMQTLIQNMQADTDARFQALEGKPGKKTEAAPRSGGAMPTVGGSQTKPANPPTDLSAPDTLPQNPATTSTVGPGAPPHPLGTLTLDQLNQGLNASPGQDAGDGYTDADAEAQYKAGYDAVVRGDYAFAEEQLRQFISLYPKNRYAPDATNWLGEALIQRGDYSDAADILLNGFEAYPTSTRAPDILLKLGIALAGAGEQDTACRTFAAVLQRFPNQPSSFKRRVASEQKKAQCR